MICHRRFASLMHANLNFESFFLSFSFFFSLLLLLLFVFCFVLFCFFFCLFVSFFSLLNLKSLAVYPKSILGVP